MKGGGGGRGEGEVQERRGNAQEQLLNSILVSHTVFSSAVPPLQSSCRRV